MPQEEPEGGDPVQYATIKVGRQAVWPLSLDSSYCMEHLTCYMHPATYIMHPS